MASRQSFFSADLKKFYEIDLGTESPSFWKIVCLWVNNFGLQTVAIFRLYENAGTLYKNNKLLGIVPLFIATILNFFVKAVYHINIEASQFGPGLYIGHIGTIYIGRAKIGSNASITHSVTIGVGHSAGKEGLPVIGDNVWIGTGAIITGAITIGNNVTITAGTVLSRDVPDNALVSGNPGRVVLQNFDNKKMFGSTKEKQNS
jgi:serine O-acetyltransferase